MKTFSRRNEDIASQMSNLQCPMPNAGLAGHLAFQTLHFALCRVGGRLAIAVLLLLLAACPSRQEEKAGGQFGQTGERKITTIASTCRTMSDFVFSPDGQRVIYAGATSDNRSLPAGVWVNDSLIGNADSVFEIGFTENNEPWFIGADSGRAFLYYRYAQPRAYEQVMNPSFSRDGSRSAYLTANGGRRALILGDGSTRMIGGVLDYALSPTGDRFAYATRDSENWFVVEGDDTSDIYDWVQDMSYSRDGVNLAYAALADDEWFAVVNGEELEHLDSNVVEVSDVVLSDDGNHVAYVVTEADDQTGDMFEYVVVDDHESDSYDDISGPVFSPHGDNFAFMADDGDGQFVVTPAGEDSVYDEVWDLGFSPDGVHIGYSARSGDDELVVVDGKERDAYDAVDKVVFSHDGRRFGYGAVDGDDFVWVVGNVR